MIELRHVRKSFSEATPLKDVNTIINKGDVISVIGPSGTGKSTLLRCINLLDPPTSGEIIVDGEVITDKKFDKKNVRRKIGMVFQSFNLFGHLTVIENLMKPQIDLLGISKQEAFDKSMKLLRRVGMASRYLHYPEQLSGGQKQRVAIARTLAMEPEIMLFDEPTSALDPKMVEEVQSVISDLAANGTTMMIVTHEMKFAREISNRVFYMDQGEIYEDGTPEQIFENPLKDRTRRFIRKLQLLEIEIESEDYDFQGIAYKIENYCYKNGIPLSGCLAVRLAFEELCQNIIMPVLIKNVTEPKLKLIFEYDSNHKTMAEEIYFNGEPFNFENTDDELAMKMLQLVVNDMSCQVVDEDGYTNLLKISIKPEKLVGKIY